MLRREVLPEHTAAYARGVEDLGFDELWVVEDCFYAGGIAAGAVALAATERISVGLGVLPAVMRNPATTALEIAALARMFPGRVRPGIGHGVTSWMHQIGAFPSSQLAALQETTSAVRALLRGERVTVDGRHVHLDDVVLEFPPPVVPPVATGVRGPRSLRVSGRVADGTVLTELSVPAYVRWARERIDEGRAEAGRTDAHHVTVYAYAAPDRDAVRPLVADGVRSGGSSGQWGALTDELSALEDAAELPDAWLDELTISGDSARRSFDALRDAGADSVVLIPAAEDPVAALDQLAALRSTLT
ncbi:LLM class flavin-dependent oxidoreductase [Pseudonocardia sp. KRD-169]|uniref:LLM class flavin-dependent oxidoreductase n=2 Tax=Pseudonocardia abyssalis TaxID=2792008 RepID=A0ABS6UPT5_9PSEU|nr:LLM class flavin-dependent oxidoreductase [Pseudonocardia abyssalis]MBW0134272.1 LLM class flavin-dependent oxidoreductase [Pseudonocardia abyssalis]